MLRDIKNFPAGMTKAAYMEAGLHEAIHEAKGFDLLTMGRGEGPGCYCYANNVLKETLNAIARNYPFVVIDNEAGLENLSRRIVAKVDLLLLVTDPSQRGLETVKRLYDLTREMKNEYGRLGIVVNRCRNRDAGLPESAEELKRYTQAEFLLGLPDDEDLARRAERGEPVHNLLAGNPVVAAVDRMLEYTGAAAKKT